MNNIDKRPLIVHVDDDDANRYAVKRILERSQYQVLSASDGKSGMELIYSSSPDLIILDIRLPDVDGRDLCRQIKRTEKFAKIPVLQMSANFTTSEDTVAGLESGADGYLVQPIDPAVLIATIRSLLRVRTAEQEAERSNMAKSQFLANMSHEIRTPLGAMVGFLDLLKDENLSAKNRAEYLSIVERNSIQLLTLIDDILDLSKVESGHLAFENIPVDVRDFFQTLKATWELTAKKQGIDFKMQELGDLPKTILADPTRLRQILINIVGNAIKFTSKGQVEVEISYAHGQFDIQVTDTGVGISVEQAQKLFQPFSQADASMSRKFGGTGLGLILSRQLAIAMGGNVTLVRSTLGQGSHFAIKVRAESLGGHYNLESHFRQTQSSSFGIEGLRTLIVDDSPDNRKLIDVFLTKQGVYIEMADNGKLGFEKALESKYDVIIMDVQMPVMDGYEATQKLRQQGVQTPIIALTAHAMVEERTRCLQSGFSDYLSKPVDKVRLYEVIKEHSRRLH